MRPCSVCGGPLPPEARSNRKYCSPDCRSRGQLASQAATVNGKMRAWRAANPERAAEHRRKWRERNAEKRAAYRKAYAKANPDKIADTARRHRARRKNATVEQFDSVEIFERDGWVCGICGEPIDREVIFPHPASATLDHVIPLAKGGEHSRANTQCAHALCNSTKSDRVA